MTAHWKWKFKGSLLPDCRAAIGRSEMGSRSETGGAARSGKSIHPRLEPLHQPAKKSYSELSRSRPGIRDFHKTALFPRKRQRPRKGSRGADNTLRNPPSRRSTKIGTVGRGFTIARATYTPYSLELCSCPYDTKTRFQPTSFPESSSGSPRGSYARPRK